MQAAPGYAQLRSDAGMYPFSLTGDALTRYINKAVADYKRQASQFNLVR
jgi:putative tricarboxylic transport membrane protein